MRTEWDDDGVATLTFDQPKSLNALNPKTLTSAVAAFGEVLQNPKLRAVVLTGEGRGFSAGGDVKWFSELAEAGGSVLKDTISKFMEEQGNPFSLALQECRVPVVTAVNGACAGGAVGVALSADVVVMGKSAFFVIPQVQELGLVPDLGATWGLARRLGRSRALGVTLLGEKLDAETAEKWGLVWKVVPDDVLVVEAQKVAKRLARAPFAAVVATRALVDAASQEPYGQALLAERRDQRTMLESEYFRKASAAFAAKAAQKK